MTDVPRGWERTTLRKLGIEAKSGFPSGRHNKSGKGIPHLRPMNVDRLGRIDLAEVKYVNPDKDVRLTRGDVLFNNTNSPPLVGKTAYFDRSGEFAFSNHMTRLRASGGIDAKFLAVQLHTLWGRGFFRALCTKHVNQASVSTQPLLDVEIALPPLVEQRRIVAAIEEQFSRLEAAEGTSAHARTRADALAAASLERVLCAWPSVELGSLAREVRYGTSTKCTYDAIGTAVLRIPNIVRGRVDTSDLKKASKEVDLSALLVRRGDLLVVRTNGSRSLIGRVAPITSHEDMAFASYLIRVRLEVTRADPEFVALALSTPAVRSQIEERAATSAGQYNLNIASLRTLPIPLPPPEEQRRVVAEMEQQLSLISSLRAAVDSVQQRSVALRHALLQCAFRGELVPQDPNEEPASVLLDRIHADRAAAPKPKRRKRATA